MPDAALGGIEGGELAGQLVRGRQQWDSGLAFTFGVSAHRFSHGIPGMGQGAGKTRPLPPSQLQVP